MQHTVAIEKKYPDTKRENGKEVLILQNWRDFFPHNILFYFFGSKVKFGYFRLGQYNNRMIPEWRNCCC
jgi:hypothetical protein